MRNLKDSEKPRYELLVEPENIITYLSHALDKYKKEKGIGDLLLALSDVIKAQTLYVTQVKPKGDKH